jgi:hypothetical protein
VTDTQTIEIVDANIKASSTLRNYEFINCEINGIFESSTFLGCNVRNSQISKSTIEHTELLNTKLLSCKVEGSTLNNCFFMEGYLNSDMIGGIFRSGQLGPFATLDVDVKIVSDHENFFKTKWDDEEDKGDKKGKITGFGK